jgi:predicted nucleotidyltransferase
MTQGDILYSANSLMVRAVSTEQLLAMKLCAWRDAIDRGDARLLLEQMSGSFDEIWDAVKPFVPPHHVDKASYALQDLWDLSNAT